MQQVNLFTDAFKPPKVKLPLEQIIAIPLVVLVIVVGLSFALSSYLNQQNQELTHLREQNTAMQERLKVLNEKAEKLRQDDSLIAANQRLLKTLHARQNMISTLDRVVVKEAEGFSYSLVALARQREEGLWLTSILLGGTNSKMVLQGVTTKAELVPIFLQKLRQEPSFLGRNFALFELNESESQNAWLGFTLTADNGSPDSVLGVKPQIQGSDNTIIDSFERVINEP
tara:strand:- start:28879 stop:29562 length:684 start_codon:yes stop_codon:yes gene_type:complete